MSNILTAQPANMEWRVYRNDSTVMTVAVLNNLGEPMDLSGWVFTGQVKNNPKDLVAVATINVNANAHILSLDVNTTNFDNIMYFDVQGTNEDLDKTKTLFAGTIYIEEDVTR